MAEGSLQPGSYPGSVSTARVTMSGSSPLYETQPPPPYKGDLDEYLTCRAIMREK